MRILGIVVLGIAAVLSAHPVYAAAEECNDAISTYTLQSRMFRMHSDDTLGVSRAAPVTMIVHTNSVS
jgi:hypothetical protein